MSSSETSDLRIGGGRSTLEIQLLDSNFAPVASTTGDLNITVPAGLYEIRFREGSNESSQLVKAGSDGVTIPAPHFDRTSTSREHHQRAAVEASDQIAKQAADKRLLRRGRGRLGGLLVMVRNAAGSGFSFPEAIADQLTIQAADGSPPAGRGHWQVEASKKEQWALWAAALPQGGYTLSFPGDGAAAPATRQALWVDPGWQTTLFIPNTADGPAPDQATIHITNLGQWSAWDEASDVAIALENVLNGLRGGRSVVPDDLDQLFHAKFVNPFLGIAAAHALLLDPAGSRRLLTTVMGNLERLLPGNPDVVALGYRALAYGAAASAGHDVSSPPILYAGYSALIRADARDHKVIRDGSPADNAAARLLISGIYTTWTDDQPATTTTEPQPAAARDATGGPETEIGGADPATERILDYINSAAQLEDVDPETIVGQRSVSQLALGTGLPSGAVHSALSAIKESESS